MPSCNCGGRRIKTGGVTPRKVPVRKVPVRHQSGKDLTKMQRVATRKATKAAYVKVAQQKNPYAKGCKC